MGTETAAPSEWRWLVSRRADFWAACGGASLAIALGAAYLALRGDRELDAIDLVFSDLHLGATYGAIATRRLWSRMPLRVVLLPLLVVAACVAVGLLGAGLWLDTALVYLAIWHRGRQNFGVARFYQRAAGGPRSAAHGRLFSLAVYAPMVASALFYTSAYPGEIEQRAYVTLPFAGHPLRTALDLAVSGLAAAAVVAYFAHARGPGVHPGERWLVAAHAAALGTAYFLGARRVSFLLVLAVFHEIQYLYFAWAVARPKEATPSRAAELRRFLFGFLRWPILSVLFGLYLNHGEAPWVIPLGQGVLLAHYWLDGVIWKGPAMRPAG